MSTLIYVCEKCDKEIEVEPTETSQYRGITCENCGAMFPVLNSELKTKRVLPRLGTQS